MFLNIVIGVKASGPLYISNTVIGVKASGPPHVLNTVIGVKASGPPHVFKHCDRGESLRTTICF